MNRSHSVLTGQLFLVFVLWTSSAFVLLKELARGRREPILASRRVPSVGKEMRMSAGAALKRWRLDAEEERILVDERPFLGL